jgi:hypothetical protein
MDYAAITNRLLYQLSYVGMDFWIEPVAILNALSKCVKPHHDVRVALADHLNSHRSGIFSKYYSHFLHSGHPPFSVKVCDSGRPALSHTLFPHGAICVR